MQLELSLPLNTRYLQESRISSHLQKQAAGRMGISPQLSSSPPSSELHSLSCDPEVIQAHAGQSHPKYPQTMMEKPSGRSLCQGSPMQLVCLSLLHITFQIQFVFETCSSVSCLSSSCIFGCYQRTGCSRFGSLVPAPANFTLVQQIPALQH